MVRLGDEAHVEACFSLFGDSAILDARYVHSLRRTYQRPEIILDAPDGLLGDVGRVESCFGPFGGGTSIGAI